MPVRQYSSKRSNAARKVAAAMLPSPCSICGRVVTADMQWQADHITPRVIAEAQGWTANDIDSPSNIAPSHASCNARSGAKVGNQLRSKAQPPTRHVPNVKRPTLKPFSDGITNTPAVAPQILSPEAAQDDR